MLETGKIIAGFGSRPLRRYRRADRLEYILTLPCPGDFDGDVTVRPRANARKPRLRSSRAVRPLVESCEARILLSTTTIGFDDLPAKTLLNSQYQTLGVDFANSAIITASTSRYPAYSGSQVASSIPSGGDNSILVLPLGKPWVEFGGYVTGHVKMEAVDTTGKIFDTTFTSGATPNQLLDLKVSNVEKVFFYGLGAAFTLDDFFFVTPGSTLEKASIALNDTTDKTDNITLFNPTSTGEGFTQTIPARVTNLGSSPATFQLSVDRPGAATLSKSSVTLAAGASTEVIVTPKAVSSAPYDVHIIAKQDGVQVGEDDLTIVSVIIPQHIRNADTPAGMKDRIPPRIITPVDVAITPSLTGSGQSVQFRVEGQSGYNGTVGINGGKTSATLSKSGTIEITGFDQTVATGDFDTDPINVGLHAGKLILAALIRGSDVKRSGGFSVAAIPVKMVETLEGDVTDGHPAPGHSLQDRGLVSGIQFVSDSGVAEDLDGIEVIESVQIVTRLGFYAKIAKPDIYQQSKYYNIQLWKFGDVQATSQESISQLVSRFGGYGILSVNQVHLFRDLRTGSSGITIPNSGYVMSFNVFTVNDDYYITTSKYGASVVVGTHASDAGSTQGQLSVTQKLRVILQ